MTDFPDSTIDRKTLLPQLFPHPENYLLLAGLAGTAKDSARRGVGSQGRMPRIKITRKNML